MSDPSSWQAVGATPHPLAALHLAAMIAGVVVLVYLPTHLLLGRRFPIGGDTSA